MADEVWYTFCPHNFSKKTVRMQCKAPDLALHQSIALSRAQVRSAWIYESLSAWSAATCLSLDQVFNNMSCTGTAHKGCSCAAQKGHRLRSTLHWSKCSLNAPWPTDSLCTSLRCHSYLAAGAGSSTLPATCTTQQYRHGLGRAIDDFCPYVKTTAVHACILLPSQYGQLYAEKRYPTMCVAHTHRSARCTQLW